MEILVLVIAALAGSILSLGGGVLLLNKRIKKEKILLYAMPFGAGALLGVAFFDVLPEALEHGEEFGVDAALLLMMTLLGFMFFFLMERGVRWFHRHHEHPGTTSHKSLIVVGDTIHNAIDGIAIGAAFLVSVPLGIATTVAVAAHEIPQEIGDFGLLLAKGMKRRRVLLVNIFSSLATLATALITYFLGPSVESVLPLILALVAGCFIYIAAADIIPDIHEQPHRKANLQAVLLVIGIVVIPSVMFLLDNAFGLGH